MTEETQKMPAMQLSLSGNITADSFTPNESTEYEDMERVMATLGAIESGHQYWIGDALLFARDKFGEKFANLVSPEKADTYRNYAWVCSKVNTDVRQKLRSFNQAKLIATLDHSDQVALAEDFGGLPVKEFLQKVKEFKALPPPNQKQPPEPPANQPETEQLLPKGVLEIAERRFILTLRGNDLLVQEDGDDDMMLMTLKTEDYEGIAYP